LIEYTKLDNTNDVNPKSSEVIDEDSYKEKVIYSATLPKISSDVIKTHKQLNVTDIYTDEGDFVFKIDGEPIGTMVKIPRNLLKKLIYDIYLK